LRFSISDKKWERISSTLELTQGCASSFNDYVYFFGNKIERPNTLKIENAWEQVILKGKFPLTNMDEAECIQIRKRKIIFFGIKISYFDIEERKLVIISTPLENPKF
jgi:hypothetical protein